MENLRLRTWIAGIAVVLAVAFILPNFKDTTALAWWPAKKLNYGLDIQGGVQLVMGADIESVINTTVVRQTAALKSEFEKENVVVKGFTTTNASTGAFEILVGSSADSKKVEELLTKNHAGSLQVMTSSAEKVDVKYYEAYMLEQKQTIIKQAIETIRNRIDEFGVAEPQITQQGSDRILIQLPGMADAEQAKQLINTTAKLDFMIVSYAKTPEEIRKLIDQAEKAGNYSMKTTKYSEYVSKLNADLKGKIPEKTVVYFEKRDDAKNMEIGSTPLLLETDTDLTGDSLDNASVSFDQYGAPEVALRFNPAGSIKFGELTEKNIKKQMAVVLDKVVKTAPSINGKIPNGSAVITLGRGGVRENVMDEAKLIATSLRAGALPVTLEQLEERRVGPSLGLDALQKARLAAIIGGLIIMIFMLVYYKGMGVITSITLLLNTFFIIAVIGSLGATLTLPGIAGMALTFGFAVDANVLINERIKEELATGMSIQSAIKEGYARAMSAIIDSNITNAATACILLYFGTGPVRGFAVTLLIGLVATLFANVFISKVIVDNLVYKFGMKKISV